MLRALCFASAIRCGGCQLTEVTQFEPPTVIPPTRPLSVLQSLRAARRNVLEIIPELAYRQPMVSGRMGARWHMVQDPIALRRVFLDNVENYPKSEVMVRMLRLAVGDSLFTSEGDAWRWQRRAVAPVFAQRNITALAPMMQRRPCGQQNGFGRAVGMPNCWERFCRPPST